MESNDSSLVIQIDGRDALPVRAIPYVTGWKLSPDEICKQLARRVDPLFIKLENLIAYHVKSGKAVQMWPKEWDAFVARLNGLESDLRAEFQDADQGYAAWRRASPDALPPGVFVWRDVFETDFSEDFGPSRLSIVDERRGDRLLAYAPVLSKEERDMILSGFDTPTKTREQSSPALQNDQDEIMWDSLPERYAAQEAEKQAAGRYNLEEAAKLISASGEASEEQMLEKFVSAAQAGNLPTYMPGRNARNEYASQIGRFKKPDTFYDECFWDELNEWLATAEPRIRYRFPVPSETALPAALPTTPMPQTGTEIASGVTSESTNTGEWRPPGKEPNTSVGKLAVKAAWEIECTEGRRATDIQVMDRLQKWADNGSEPAFLKKSDLAKRSVIWLTSKYKEKIYTLEACQKALESWNKSRE